MHSQATPKSSPNPLIKNLFISTLPAENSHRRLKKSGGVTYYKDNPYPQSFPNKIQIKKKINREN